MKKIDDGTHDKKHSRYRAFPTPAVLLRKDYRGPEKYTIRSTAIIVHFQHPWYSFVKTTADRRNTR
jgi:hypothetical protein